MAAQILRKLADKTPASVLKALANLWLPFLGSGIRIVEVSPDYRYAKVTLKRTWYNSNYVGTQFGGSIYAMTDPFYMLLLLNNLSREYIVWDKAARIEFKKPGRSKLTAEFRLDQGLIDEVISKVDLQGKYVFDLPVSIFDEDQIEVASVVKTLYVRKKQRAGATDVEGSKE